MQTLARPQWLLLVNTLPLVLLALLGAGTYSVIHTLLPPASVAGWQAAGWGLAGLGGATLLAGGLTWQRGRPLGVVYAVLTLLVYSTFLGWTFSQHDQLLPRAVPGWMVPTDVVLYAWTFLMPTLAHALLVLVVRTTPGERPDGALLSFLLALVVPFGFFVLVQVGDVFGWNGSSAFERGLRHLLLIGLITLVPTTFLYFLVRGVYILGLRRTGGWGPGEVLWKVLLSVILPVAGLLVNMGLGSGFGNHFDEGHGIFGNFSSPWFFGLAVLNGVLLSYPAGRLAPGWRLALLAGRSVLLGYTTYFFLVFLPFLPLSVLAVILIGTGFLMLTPLLLLVLHLRELSDDVAALRPRYGRARVLGVLLGGAAVLPLAVTATYYHQRLVLHEALTYAYSPDYARRYHLDTDALAATLATVRHHKDNNQDFFLSRQQPYLSTYFNWLVLDNLMLSESKTDELEKLFLNDQLRPDRWRPQPQPAGLVSRPPGGPRLRQLHARSRYDAAQQAWVSQLDLEVANGDVNNQRGEYVTAFSLPAGCWVSDYYLDIDGRREPGILAEKRAADWLYRQVVDADVPRDPGLLAYDGPDRVRLHVYPVAGATPRRTGLTLLHREPLSLAVDDQTVTLGDPATAAAPVAAITAPGGAVSYLSPAAKRALPLVQRRPYYHFLLDVSAGQYARKADYQRWIKEFLAAHPLAEPPRFTLVNTYATAVPAGADWQRQLDEFPNAGGCYFTGAMRRVLADAWQHPAPTYPLLVAVTDSLARTVLPADLADFAPAYPESPAFVALVRGGQATVHSLRENSQAVWDDDEGGQSWPPAPAVRAWPTAARPLAYLPDDDQPAVVLHEPGTRQLLPTPAGASPWLTGLQLHGAAQWQVLHPMLANAQFGELVQASFRAHLLSPWTAFLALENDAQKAALRRKQTQTMAANANLDTVEAEPNAPSAVPLDDYAAWLLALGVAFGVWRLRRRP